MYRLCDWWKVVVFSQESDQGLLGSSKLVQSQHAFKFFALWPILREVLRSFVLTFGNG